jgi:sugar phosphate permease
MESSSKNKTQKLIVFTLLYIGFCVSYVDRAAISISMATIGKEFSLNASEMGVVLSTFFIGYALMQLPGGWLADRFGSKRVIIIAIGFWSLFTVLTGLAWSLSSIVIIRLLFGLGEGAFPCATLKGIAENFSRIERPKVTTLLLSSNYIGNALSPIIVAPLLLYFGWRNMFYAIGIGGIVYVVVYWFAVRRPAGDEPCEAVKEKDEQVQKNKVGMMTLLKIPLMWQLVVCWFCLSIVNKGLDSWMPIYLLTVRHLDLKSLGLLTPLPFIAGGIATAIGGWVMVRLFSGKEKYLLILSAGLTTVFLYFMYKAETVMMLIAFQSLAYFFKAFVLATTMALPMKMFPGSIVGSATGMINLGGQSGGFVAPVIMGLLISAFGNSYDVAFEFLIGAACLSVVAAMTIKSGKALEIELLNKPVNGESNDIR